MKSTIKTIAAIIVLTITVTTSFAKTKKMSYNEFQLKYNKIDSSVIGTWEKSWNSLADNNNTFCQFNANGTFLTFEKTANHIKITGKGNWKVENSIITILYANEVSSTVSYQATDNSISFGNTITYAKPTSVSYVSR